MTKPIESAIAKPFMLMLLFGCASSITLAQDPDPKQPPPPTQFDTPRQLEANEFFEEYELTFQSAANSGAPNNDSVRLTVIVPADRRSPIPSVLALHYWGAVDLRVERAMAVEMAKRGIGTVIMPLPYHLGRTPPGYRSGELAIQPDPASLKAMMEQSVLDARRAIDWMSSWSVLSPTEIGIAGTSLGAIVAALVFAIEPRCVAGAFILGGIDLAHILWNSSRVVEAREALRRKGYTEAVIREALASIEPGNYLVKGDLRPSLVIGAKHDTVIPAEDTQKLIRALQTPNALWLDTGHFGGALAERQILRSTATFFASVFGKRPFVGQIRISAPTVRIGFQANIHQGLQVVAGVDLWRSNSRGDAFVSVLATPRGVQAFVGTRLNREVSIGIVLLPKRATVGLFWSQIF